MRTMKSQQERAASIARPPALAASPSRLAVSTLPSAGHCLPAVTLLMLCGLLVCLADLIMRCAHPCSCCLPCSVLDLTNLYQQA